MRKAFFIVASCGIVVLGFRMAGAGAPDSSSDAAPAPSLTDPVPTSPKQESSDVWGDDAPLKRVPARSPSMRSNAPLRAAESDSGAADFDSPAAQDSKIIHAEYQRHAGDSERSNVRQVRGTVSSPASPFDDSTSPSALGASSDEDAPRPLRARHGHRIESHHSEPAPSAASQGGIDASQAPIIAVQWLKRSPITVGQECACDLVVKNAGKAAAKEVSVDAFFPVTVRLTHAEPMPADNQDHVTWTIPSLAPGEERTIHIKLVPSRRGGLATRTLVRFTEQASNLFVVEEPQLNVALRGPKDLLIGDPAMQSITVSNPGTGTAHNVTIEAHCSKGLEHPRGERMVVTVGALNPGESRVVRIPLVAVAGGEQTIAVHASAAGDLHRELLSKINVIAPKVKLTAEGPSLRYLGRKAAYVVTVANDGGTATNNIHVTHKLPAGFKFVAADKGGEYDDLNRSINWFIGRLEVNESIRLKVELATTQIGTHLHSFAAVSEQGARSEARLETAVDGIASLAVEIIDQNDPVEIGVETAYEIHVRNDGTKAAENVSISCELPLAVQMLRAEGATAPGARSTGDDRGSLGFRPIAVLEPGKTAIYRVYVKGRKEGNHRFRVHLSADSIKEPLVYEEMTKFYGE